MQINARSIILYYITYCINTVSAVVGAQHRIRGKVGEKRGKASESSSRLLLSPLSYSLVRTKAKCCLVPRNPNPNHADTCTGADTDADADTDVDTCIRPQEIKKAKASGHVYAVKLYPAGECSYLCIYYTYYL